VLRTALKPRWLALFALLVVIVVTFAELGLWQLHVAQDKGRQQTVQAAADRPVAFVGTVLRPHTPFPSDGSGRRVVATGRYDAGGQFLVAPRRLAGTTGYWVVTPLVVEATGATLPVVRGFARDLSSVPEPPTGMVTVTTSLAPGESPTAPPTTGSVAPKKYLVRGSVDLAELVNEWPGDLYNAFGFVVDERQAAPAWGPVALDGLERVPPPQVDSGLQWRNAAYAVQWWLFAAFAAYMWVRMVRDDAQRDGDEPVTRAEGEPA
jgi:cytochrome oxidase assembly protein ShyY1